MYFTGAMANGQRIGSVNIANLEFYPILLSVLSNLLQLSQVNKLTAASGAVVSLRVTFHNFKHNTGNTPLQ